MDKKLYKMVKVSADGHEDLCGLLCHLNSETCACECGCLEDGWIELVEVKDE